MLIGVPKEVKTHEYRVGLVPGSVRELVHHGHRVVVESGAGAGIGFDDTAYLRAGAEIVTGAADVFGVAERAGQRLHLPEPARCDHGEPETRRGRSEPRERPLQPQAGRLAVEDDLRIEPVRVKREHHRVR